MRRIRSGEKIVQIKKNKSMQNIRQKTISSNKEKQIYAEHTAENDQQAN